MTHTRIDTNLEVALVTAYEYAAAQHVLLWRKELAKFNLTRHPLTLHVAQGMVTLMVGERYWYELVGPKLVTHYLRTLGHTIANAPYAAHIKEWK